MLITNAIELQYDQLDFAHQCFIRVLLLRPTHGLLRLVNQIGESRLQTATTAKPLHPEHGNLP